MEIGQLNLPSETLWWLNRSSGLVLLALFTFVVVLGVFSTQRAAQRRIPTFVPNQLHRSIALFAFAFLIAHILTAVLDDYVEIDWVDAVVPFAAAYRPLWLGLGSIAFDATIAIMVTSWAKSRMSERAWHVVHVLAYPAWLLAVIHGLAIGTDSRNVLVIALNVICVLTVAMALGARLMWSDSLPGWMQVVALILIAVVPILLAVWALAGPLSAGWSSTS